MPDQLETIVQRMIDAGESEDNIASVIKEFKKQAPSKPSYSAVSNEEPGTFTGGFLKSIKDQVGEAFSGAKPMLESAAHPQSAGDFSALLLPATALGTGYGALRGWAGAAKNLLTGAQEGAADREGLKKIPAVLKGMYQTATDTVSGRDRAFQRLPLAEQIDSFGPGRTNPVTTRGAAPPMSTVNPNDIPLSQLMDRLPTTGPMPMGRAGTPTPSFANPNDIPLWQQMEQLASAPTTASAASGSSRIGMAPASADDAGFIQDILKKVSGQFSQPNTFESEFAKSLEQQIGSGRSLSPKQKKVLYDLYQRPAGSVGTPQAAAPVLGAAEREALARNGYSPEMIAKIEAELGKQ